MHSKCLILWWMLPHNSRYQLGSAHCHSLTTRLVSPLSTRPEWQLGAQALRPLGPCARQPKLLYDRVSATWLLQPLQAHCKLWPYAMALPMTMPARMAPCEYRYSYDGTGTGRQLHQAAHLWHHIECSTAMRHNAEKLSIHSLCQFTSHTQGPTHTGQDHVQAQSS